MYLKLKSMKEMEENENIKMLAGSFLADTDHTNTRERVKAFDKS